MLVENRTGEKRAGKPVMAPNTFKFQTGDVAAMCNFMYGLRDLVKTVRFHVTPKGIKIGEAACQDNLFLFANFLAERFTMFECQGESTICFYPEHMHKVLNNHQQRDVMTCQFSSANEEVLMITKVPQGDERLIEEYAIPLLAGEPDEYESPHREVDYLLAFNSGILSTILTGLNSLEKEFEDNWINITCTPEQVSFSMEGGCMIGHARFTLKTSVNSDEPPQKRARRNNKSASDENLDEVDIAADQQEITHQYRLQYLHQMLKCFSITKGGIFMYVSKDYPLVFEVKVGILGELKAALMFRDSKHVQQENDV